MSEPIRQVTPQEAAEHLAQGVEVAFTGDHGSEGASVLERVTGLVSKHSTTHIILVSGQPGARTQHYHLSRVVGLVDVITE